jgi:hypothetical protein
VARFDWHSLCANGRLLTPVGGFLASVGLFFNIELDMAAMKRHPVSCRFRTPRGTRKRHACTRNIRSR